MIRKVKRELSNNSGDSPLFDRLMGLPGNPHRNFQKAAVFGVLTCADFTGSGAKRGSFAVGGDPEGLKVS